ncbi:MAG: M50 family metallopeptidase [Kofleriaceae bacterium]|nr:M50 family metallopeptidase [Kofleriaceae bacterium]
MRALLVFVLVAVATPAEAQAEEVSDRTLFYGGLALAPPTYLVGVTLHEGSHAIAAKLVGGSVEDVHLFPPGRDPKSGRFRFGWVYARGLRTKTQKAVFYLAPKLTDAALLGGFAALAFTDAWPDSRWGGLALTVFATGLWIDYAKDIFLFHGGNDVVKTFRLWCMTGWRQVPARLVYAATIVGLGVIVAKGYQRTFRTLQDETASPAHTPFMLPLANLAF